MEDAGTFGERLRKIRHHLNITQTAFARKLHMSGGSLSEIENGKYKPGHEFYEMIVKVFEVNLYYLFFGEGEMFLDYLNIEKRIFRYSGDNKDMQRFFDYLERSVILQHSILAHFRRLMIEEGDVIERDVQVYESENKK